MSKKKMTKETVKTTTRKKASSRKGNANGSKRAAAKKAKAEAQPAVEPEALAADEASEPAGDAPAAVEKLTKIEVPELQARYLEVVGRPTGSSNKAYLIWKIREAQKGRIPVGPRRSARGEGGAFKVLPLRMEANLVDKLDEAWKRQGLHSRMDLFRKSLHAFLANAGEADVAALLATTNA